MGEIVLVLEVRGGDMTPELAADRVGVVGDSRSAGDMADPECESPKSDAESGLRRLSVDATISVPSEYTGLRKGGSINGCTDVAVRKLLLALLEPLDKE